MDFNLLVILVRKKHPSADASDALIDKITRLSMKLVV